MGPWGSISLLVLWLLCVFILLSGELAGHKDVVSSISFCQLAAQSHLCVSSSNDGNVCFWDANNKVLIREHTGHRVSMTLQIPMYLFSFFFFFLFRMFVFVTKSVPLQNTLVSSVIPTRALSIFSLSFFFKAFCILLCFHGFLCRGSSKFVWQKWQIDLAVQFGYSQFPSDVI